VWDGVEVLRGEFWVIDWLSPREEECVEGGVFLVGEGEFIGHGVFSVIV
jgi:hypothetical protein